ncbi:MAG: hypothetical protein A4E62_02250 [Syntrophorhabdus sp. PtaU1.Bin002]|nr:MAG: hypothetical protein A4E62_02250 [Syntrophorhabdus sp. PtaU1.Bin002]
MGRSFRRLQRGEKFFVQFLPLSHTCGPHDACGTHGLVRRNEHELLHTALYARLQKLQCSEYIDLHRLFRVSLHHRDMLVCCRVEDYLGFIPIENVVYFPGITDIAND